MNVRRFSAAEYFNSDRNGRRKLRDEESEEEIVEENLELTNHRDQEDVVLELPPSSMKPSKIRRFLCCCKLSTLFWVIVTFAVSAASISSAIVMSKYRSELKKFTIAFVSL